MTLSVKRFKHLLILSPVLFTLMGSLLISLAMAGVVVVRTPNEPFDAFAVRDQLLRDHQWQQILRMQQQLHILRSLPFGCVLAHHPFDYYSCAGSFYRPYSYGNEDLYIQIDPITPQP